MLEIERKKTNLKKKKQETKIKVKLYLGKVNSNRFADREGLQHYQVRDGRVLPAQVFHFLQDVIEHSQHSQFILALCQN